MPSTPAPTIDIVIECFGALSASIDETATVAVAPPYTPAALIAAAQHDFPAAASLLARTACARDDALLAADAELADGETVALIPPVSGGQAESTSDARHLTAAPLDLDSLMSETEDDTCGALVVFGGTVRLSNAGREVACMDYSAYGPLAAATMAEIETETVERHGVAHCRMQHRTGQLGLGAVSVYIVVRAVHREAAFDAARDALEQLKTRVAVWKNEHYADGSSAYLEGTEVVRPERPTGDES